MTEIRKIPNDVFNYIEKFMPFSSVDIIIVCRNEGIILTKRAIRPYQGWWHLPGSVVLKNERLASTVKRSAYEELGIRVANPKFVGNYELFTKHRHYITHLYLAEHTNGQQETIKLDAQSSEYKIVKPGNLPKKTIPIQRQMVKDAIRMGLLSNTHP